MLPFSIKSGTLIHKTLRVTYFNVSKVRVYGLFLVLFKYRARDYVIINKK